MGNVVPPGLNADEAHFATERAYAVDLRLRRAAIHIGNHRHADEARGPGHAVGHVTGTGDGHAVLQIGRIA
ncbi:hypothetical protein D9M72_557860 [compost metagenome]